jgi:hypothetical protein
VRDHDSASSAVLELAHHEQDAPMLSLALRNHHITAAAPIFYDFDPCEDLVGPAGY